MWPMRSCSSLASGHRRSEKIEHTVQPVVGLGLHSRCLIATSTMKGSFWHMRHIHVHVRGLFINLSMTEKRANVLAIILHGHFLFDDRSVQEECAKRIPTALTHRSFRGVFPFLLFFIRFTRKLVVEPPMTVDLSLVAAAVMLAPAD